MRLSTILHFCLLLSALFFCCVSSALLAQQFEYKEVVASPYQDSIHRSGKLDFKNTLSLSFKTSGYVQVLHVDEGDVFKKGDLLASLDTKELIAHKNSTYAQLQQAKRDVARITKLIERNLSSVQELELAKTKVAVNRSAYEIATYNLEKSQLFAPFDGVVLTRSADLGELQAPGIEALNVAATANNWVIRVSLTGAEISQVHIGQAVKVDLQGVGQVNGIISRVPAIASKLSGLFIVDVQLPELTFKRGIVAGQLADVRLAFTSNKIVYRVPVNALMSVNSKGQALVLVAQSNKKAHLSQAFEIFKMNNRYLYLLADEKSAAIKVVTQGWQHLDLAK